MKYIYIFLLVILIFSGCQSLNTDSENRDVNSGNNRNYMSGELPILHSAEVLIENMDFSGLELVFNINVENPNNFPIRFPDINWFYSVEDVQMLRGIFSGSGLIDAGSVEAQSINVSLTYEDIYQVVGSARNVDEVNSIFSFGIETNAGTEISWPISILHEPEISFQGITRQSLGRTMVFVFTWEVNNRNKFDLEMEEFNYNIRINNALWAADKLIDLPKINANSKMSVPVTVSISSDSIIRELVDILNRGTPVNYNNTGYISFLSDEPGLDQFNMPLNFQGSTRIR